MVGFRGLSCLVVTTTTQWPLNRLAFVGCAAVRVLIHDSLLVITV